MLDGDIEPVNEDEAIVPNENNGQVNEDDLIVPDEASDPVNEDEFAVPDEATDDSVHEQMVYEVDEEVSSDNQSNPSPTDPPVQPRPGPSSHRAGGRFHATATSHISDSDFSSSGNDSYNMFSRTSVLRQRKAPQPSKKLNANQKKQLRLQKERPYYRNQRRLVQDSSGSISCE